MGIMDEGRPKSIALIVEDDHDLQQLTAMLLQESGFETVECESAEAALAVMLLGGQNDVTMVFADIRLSGAMDGVDLAHELKMRWPHLHIILTSGNAGTRLKAMATSQCPYGRGAGKLVITGASSATVKQRWRA